MKALYLRTNYSLNLKSGGSVAHTEGVVNALDKIIDLEVISNDPLNYFYPDIQIIKPILKKVPIINELLYNFKIILKLRDRINHDFIYHRYSGESFCAAYLAKRNKTPLILEFNSFETWKIKNWKEKGSSIKMLIKKRLKLFFVSRIESYNLRFASLIVVVSDVLKDDLMKLGIPENKILVNPNGVNIERFDIVKEDCIIQLKKELELENKFVFGFIGTFGHWHGSVELAKAIEHFYFHHPEHQTNVSFLLIGDGHFMPEVHEIVSKQPWSDNVLLTGLIPQKDAPKYLKLTDCLISPHVGNPDGTKFFGSPTKLFEYMACNRPIIASNLDQIGIILEHEKTAILVEPGNIIELSNAMNELYRSKALAKSIALQAYQLVKSKYTWDKHVQKIINTFQNRVIQSE